MWRKVKLDTQHRREDGREQKKPDLSDVTRILSLLDDCFSSSFSLKYSSTHCSSNSCRPFNSSGLSSSSDTQTEFFSEKEDASGRADRKTRRLEEILRSRRSRSSRSPSSLRLQQQHSLFRRM